MRRADSIRQTASIVRFVSDAVTATDHTIFTPLGEGRGHGARELGHHRRRRVREWRLDDGSTPESTETKCRFASYLVQSRNPANRTHQLSAPAEPRRHENPGLLFEGPARVTGRFGPAHARRIIRQGERRFRGEVG